MAVSAYFGLPGSGKTTLLAYFAKKGVKSKRYQHVYSNVRLAIPGVTYIPNEAIGTYHLEKALILIDEATLFANNRDHKEFPRHVMEYFLLHRHYHVDIMLFLQEATGYDKKIRSITDRVFYVYKGMFTGWLFSRYYRIPYGIIIPDPKKNGGAQLGEILQGYRKPGLVYRIFAPSVFRPFYYRYFNSWECKQLTPLPPCYKPYEKPQRNKKEYFVALGGRITMTLYQTDFSLYSLSIGIYKPLDRYPGVYSTLFAQSSQCLLNNYQRLVWIFGRLCCRFHWTQAIFRSI